MWENVENKTEVTSVYCSEMERGKVQREVNTIGSFIFYVFGFGNGAGFFGHTKMWIVNDYFS